MRNRGGHLRWRLVIILGLLGGSLLATTGVRAEPDFLDIAFRQAWERTDLPVDAGRR